MKDQAETLFFDPLAEEGEALFDPVTAHQAMWERYAGGEVEHDYTADKFVADTEALMLDARFIGQFDAVQGIAQRMHQLCGEDHDLRTSMEASELFAGAPDNHEHHHEHEDRDAKKKHKKDKKKKFRGWFKLGRD